MHNVSGDDLTVQKLNKDNEDVIQNILVNHRTHFETMQNQPKGFIMNSQMFKNGSSEDDAYLKIPLFASRVSEIMPIMNIEHFLMLVFNRIQEMFESLAQLLKEKKESMKKIAQFHSDPAES